jgi:hypothetical protein
MLVAVGVTITARRPALKETRAAGQITSDGVDSPKLFRGIWPNPSNL